MSVTSLNVPEKFLAAAQVNGRSAGHILVYTVSSMSKSCYVMSDFTLLDSDSVFVAGASNSVPPLSNKVSLQVPGCPLIQGAELRRLYNKLVEKREIVNKDGQILIHLKAPLLNPDNSVAADYVKCADVFLWSSYGGCDTLQLWPRFQFCTDKLVDEPQKKLDGLVDVITAKELQDLRDKVVSLTAERDNLRLKVNNVSDQSEITALRAEVARLKAQVTNPVTPIVGSVNDEAKKAIKDAGFTNPDYFDIADKSTIVTYMVRNYAYQKGENERRQKEIDEQFRWLQDYRYRWRRLINDVRPMMLVIRTVLAATRGYYEDMRVSAVDHFLNITAGGLDPHV
ncbi:P38 [Indian peanut clump virus]|uniref:p38 n=1 Tax=Indian peanut clump virus TaxID=32629 RepID=Q8B0Z7_9VIRU|nr:P38 protein [Indian peanut clump virus]AAO15498.1 P38 [Indian peanut clump virus H]